MDKKKLLLTIQTVLCIVLAALLIAAAVGMFREGAALKAADPLELRIYPGADASFCLYEDDGLTYAYEKGACTRIPIRWDDATRTLTLGEREGSFPGMPETRRIQVTLPDGSPAAEVLTYTGAPVSLKL